MSKSIKNVLLAILPVMAFLLLALPSNAEEYNPQINPADFSTEITNKYFNLPVGKEIFFEAETEDGLETIQIEVTDETKVIMGVTTVVYWDRVWVDGEMIENTKDYLAQDKAGNVWYFGENVDNYEDGVLVNHDGSWIAGEDGAKPGIWMPANPTVGFEYKQEYYAGEAEDMGKVLSITETVTVPYGTFKNCLKTEDWTPLEPGHIEHKYYCPQVGNMVLETKPGTTERLELVNIDGGRPFPDVEPDYVNVDAIEFSMTNNIVNGYSDGEFKAEQGSTRGEFTKILINYKYSEAEINNCNTTQYTFSDVAGDNKFIKYICVAKKEGIVDGFSDGTYKSEQKITTQEGLKIIANTYELVSNPNSDTDDQFKPYIEAIANKKALPGDTKNSKELFERGNLVEVLYRLENVITNKESITYTEFNK
jgi:hypothetical protein